jgi:hypothetical protein
MPLVFAFHLFACLGEDPDFDKADSSGDAAAADASSSQTDAGADASASPEADAASDAPQDAAGDACGAPKDQSPCGCGGAKNCCLWEDGGTECYPAGNAPAECLSSHGLIACVGRSSCAAGQACCVVGGVLGGTCPTRLERWDTTCVSDGPNPCDGKRVLCASDSDCVLSDAGTCVAAVMDGLNRPMGICVK